MAGHQGIIFIDEQGRKWRVYLRAAYWGRGLTNKKLHEWKQRHADQERTRGHEAIAARIEQATWFEWASGSVASTAILTCKERLDSNNKVIR